VPGLRGRGRFSAADSPAAGAAAATRLRCMEEGRDRSGA
jgi:hypothetical protein